MSKKASGFEADHPLVRVTWRDTAGRGRWHTIEDAETLEPAICVSVGWILRDDAEVMTIAASRDGETSVMDSNTFPKVCVLTVEHLRVKKY